MSEKFRLDRKIGFQNTFYTNCINDIIDSIGPSIILRSIRVNGSDDLHVHHTGKCKRRFGGIYEYCRYFIDRKW